MGALSLSNSAETGIIEKETGHETNSFTPFNTENNNQQWWKKISDVLLK